MSEKRKAGKRRKGGKKRKKSPRNREKKRRKEWNGLVAVAVAPTTKNKVGCKGEVEETMTFSSGAVVSNIGHWGATSQLTHIIPPEGYPVQNNKAKAIHNTSGTLYLVHCNHNKKDMGIRDTSNRKKKCNP